MHVRIAIIGLVRILGAIIGVHVVGHRTPVNQKVRGMVWLGRNLKTASRSRGPSRAGGGPHRVIDLRQRCIVNLGIHLGELEKILAVVAGLGMIVGGLREPEIGFMPE